MFFKHFLLLLLLLNWQALYSQNLPLTKNKLIELFKNSIRQDSKTKIRTISNPWVVCNDKDGFYSSDTICISTNTDYFLNCCSFINWTFYKKGAFVLTKTELCKEPTTASVPKHEDWFSIQIKSYKQDLFIDIINQNKVIDRFKVISYEKVNNLSENRTKSEVLTLARTLH